MHIVLFKDSSSHAENWHPVTHSNGHTPAFRDEAGALRLLTALRAEAVEKGLAIAYKVERLYRETFGLNAFALKLYEGMNGKGALVPDPATLTQAVEAQVMRLKSTVDAAKAEMKVARDQRDVLAHENVNQKAALDSVLRYVEDEARKVGFPTEQFANLSTDRRIVNIVSSIRETLLRDQRQKADTKLLAENESLRAANTRIAQSRNQYESNFRIVMEHGIEKLARGLGIDPQKPLAGGWDIVRAEKLLKEIVAKVQGIQSKEAAREQGLTSDERAEYDLVVKALREREAEVRALKERLAGIGAAANALHRQMYPNEAPQDPSAKGIIEQATLRAKLQDERVVQAREETKVEKANVSRLVDLVESLFRLANPMMVVYKDVTVDGAVKRLAALHNNVRASTNNRAEVDSLLLARNREIQRNAKLKAALDNLSAAYVKLAKEHGDRLDAVPESIAPAVAQAMGGVKVIGNEKPVEVVPPTPVEIGSLLPGTIVRRAVEVVPEKYRGSVPVGPLLILDSRHVERSLNAKEHEYLVYAVNQHGVLKRFGRKVPVVKLDASEFKPAPHPMFVATQKPRTEKEQVTFFVQKNRYAPPSPHQQGLAMDIPLGALRIPIMESPLVPGGMMVFMRQPVRDHNDLLAALENAFRVSGPRNPSEFARQTESEFAAQFGVTEKKS